MLRSAVNPLKIRKFMLYLGMVTLMFSLRSIGSRFVTPSELVLMQVESVFHYRCVSVRDATLCSTMQHYAT